VSQRVSRVVVAGEPGRVTVDGEIVRHLVNVGPPGPAGPPGAGARIEGVVDTVGELPVAADPGSIWIVRPDMMHVWDEVDGWQAVGQVNVVTGPKINDLPTRPGGPQPTDEFWLASAGAAADFKSTIAALAGAVLGNISVIENSNGISFRVGAGKNYQIASGLVTFSGSGSGLRTATWTFPQAFAAAPHVFTQPRGHVGIGVWGQVGPNVPTLTNVIIDADIVSAGAGAVACFALAIGRAPN